MISFLTRYPEVWEDHDDNNYLIPEAVEDVDSLGKSSPLTERWQSYNSSSKSYDDNQDSDNKDESEYEQIYEDPM